MVVLNNSGIDDLIRCYAIKLISYQWIFRGLGIIHPNFSSQWWWKKLKSYQWINLGIGRILLEVVHGWFQVMFCNIWFNLKIADTLYALNLQVLDRITSSHYALFFWDIHVLQRYDFVISSATHLVRINRSHPNWKLKCSDKGGIVRNLWLVILRWTRDKFYTIRPSSKKQRYMISHDT